MNVAVVNLSAVALGGALGASLRYLIASIAHGMLGRDFPYGTLVVNVIGSLAIGYLLVLLPEAEAENPLLRLLLVTGLLGGFTTYSAFSVETLQLLHDGHAMRAGLNVAATLTFCFIAVWAGWLISRAVHGAG